MREVSRKGRPVANRPPSHLKSGIIATAIGGLIVAVILSAIPQMSGFLSGVAAAIRVGLTWLWASMFSNYSLPGWLVLIAGVLSLLGILAVVLLLILRLQSQPNHVNYTEDLLYGAKWRWSWKGNKISDLWCFCPTCDAQLVYSEGFAETLFICERCPPDRTDGHRRSPGRVIATIQGGDRQYALAAAEREILRRIRTGEMVPPNA